MAVHQSKIDRIPKGRIGYEELLEFVEAFPALL